MKPAPYRGQSAAGVEQDWVRALPDDRQRFFDAQTTDWERIYGMLSVVLNDALTARRRGELVHARQQAACSADLARRLSQSLLPALSAFARNRQWERSPIVEPLQPDLFRGEAAQRAATWNRLLHWPMAIRPWQFALKLLAVRHAMEKATARFCEVAEDIAEGLSVHPDAGWQELETLHDDLNTVLREVFVVLKSFLCAVSVEGYCAFEVALGEAKLKGFSQAQGISPATP